MVNTPTSGRCARSTTNTVRCLFLLTLIPLVTGCKAGKMYSPGDADLPVSTPDAGVASGSGGRDGSVTGGADSGQPDMTPDLTVDPGCPTGQHMCAGTCMRNDDPRTCGTSCTPCEPVPDGTATCDGTRCGASCPAGKKLCSGNCIDMAAACMGCPTGTHECQGQCPSSTSVNACGSSCNPCPVPPGASQATCDGTRCEFQCMSGYHRCGTGCARDDDPTQCGSSCAVCPTIANAVAQCLAGTCAAPCNPGFHLCGGQCVSNTSVLSCGTSCDPCMVPLGGGSATCTAGSCGGTCPTGRKLCKGSCVDPAAACDMACPADTHNCAEICVPNTSVNNCGATSCTACPRPAGASSVGCNGTMCDFTCGAGYHRCGTTCAADDDATACGTTCTNCPTDTNGTAACQGGMCALVCRSGYHLCGTRCVSNMDVATCGATSCSACTPTTGGAVSCDGLSCVRTCPTANTKLCGTACIPTANACNGVCTTPNTHNCSGVCQPNGNVNSCVDRCSPCPIPTNGTPTCGATGCGITCSGNFHECTGACLSNSNVNSCGTRCSACPAAPPNGTPVCTTAGVCDFMCDAGRLKCGTACYVCCRDADCPVAANEAATCLADHTCSTRCVPTATRCRGTCRPMRIVGACMVAQLAAPQGVYWCDADSTSSYFKLNVTQSELDGSGTTSLDQYCFVQTDDLTLIFCSDAGRRTRMDTGYVFTVIYDADGRAQSQTLTNGSGRPRVCMPLP